MHRCRHCLPIVPRSDALKFCLWDAVLAVLIVKLQVVAGLTRREQPVDAFHSRTEVTVVVHPNADPSGRILVRRLDAVVDLEERQAPPLSPRVSVLHFYMYGMDDCGACLPL